MHALKDKFEICPLMWSICLKLVVSHKSLLAASMAIMKLIISRKLLISGEGWLGGQDEWVRRVHMCTSGAAIPQIS